MLTSVQRAKTFLPDAIASYPGGMDWLASLEPSERHTLQLHWRVSLAIDALIDLAAPLEGRTVYEIACEGRKGTVLDSQGLFPEVVEKIRAAFGDGPLIYWFRDGDAETVALQIACIPKFNEALHGVAIDYSYFYQPERLAQLECLASKFRYAELSNVLRCLFEKESNGEKTIRYCPYEDGVPGVRLRSSDRKAIGKVFSALSATFGSYVVRLEQDSPQEEEPMDDPDKETEEEEQLLSLSADPPGASLLIDGGFFSIQKYYEKLEALV